MFGRAIPLALSAAYALTAMSSVIAQTTEQDGVVVFSPSEQQQEVVEQRREQMERYIWQETQLEPVRAKLRELEREKEYRRTREQKIGIPPEVIIEQRRDQEQQKFAQNVPLKQSECKFETINYSNADPKAIRLPIATRSPAHLTFQDSTGQVWPIAGHTQGDNASFSSTILDAQPHIYEVSVKAPYATATNNLLLEGFPQPIVVRLVGEEEKNICVLNVRLSMPGPNANTNPVMLSDAGFGGGEDDVMFRLAVNDIPSSAEEVDLSGIKDAGRAWIINDRLYVRSQYWMESPPRTQIQDVSGIYVYRIEDPTQATAYLRTPDGESVRITIGS
ncbi:DotH/IcmK family type IV secretion protein [Marinobacter shengliensis]|uniref:DotH/IcmK family type IV secretion protein n=1 Tax=Marinobacter shengliensis TaxID=1389223 RepID=UPI001107B0BF|nr:DotH/IcmK family type IV secretion protein [Marinobacter shengliensis]